MFHIIVLYILKGSYFIWVVGTVEQHHELMYISGMDSSILAIDDCWSRFYDPGSRAVVFYCSFDDDFGSSV